MYYRLRRYPSIVLALTLLATRATGQDIAAFDVQLRAALESHNNDAIGELVRANRLDVLPFARVILDEGARARLDGDHTLFDRNLEFASTLGKIFIDVYGERSTSILASHFASWSDDQLRIKLVADSLQVEGTTKRTNRDTRDQAFEDYERALELYEQIGDKPGKSTVLGGLGYVAYYRDGQSALDFNTRALESRRSIDDRVQIGNALNTIATVYRVRLDDPESALEYYRQALEIRENIGDFKGLGRTLAFTGDLLYRILGRFEEALDYFLKAYDAGMIAGDSTRAAGALNVAGTLMTDLGRYSDALEPLVRARDLMLALNDIDGASGVTNNIGMAYRRLGDFDAAMESYQLVVRRAREQGLTELEARALNNIAVVFIWAERPDRVIPFAERAKTAYEKAGSEEGILVATINLGSAHFELRQYKQAREYASRAVALADSLEDLISQVKSLALLANIQTRTGAFEPAVENFERARVIAEYMSLPDNLFAVILGLGEVYERSGIPGEAIASYEEAFALLERTRRELGTGGDKAGFFSQQQYAFVAYIHFLSKLHLAGAGGAPAMRAFLVAERAKARSFLDELAASIAGVQGDISDELGSEQQELLGLIAEMRGNIQYESQFSDADRDAIAEWRKALSDYEDRFTDLQRRLRQENPRYSNLQYPEPSSIEDLQTNVLEDGTVMLAFAVGDTSSTLWVVTNDAAELFMLPPRDEIAAGVDVFRFALSDPEASDPTLISQTGHALYKMLVEPAEEYVDRSDHLIIVPDGVLSYIPFEALVRTEAPPSSFGEISFLLKEAAISYAQSASVLDQIVSDRPDRTRVPDRDLLAFGDPVFSAIDPGELVPETIGRSGELLEPLPFSGIEVESIASLLDHGRVDVFLREAATESELKERAGAFSYRFLHLATHGLIDEDSPDFSSIVLTTTDDRGEDGFLQAAEIFNLRLDTDLVVLSACETGLGQMIKGEGIVGLTRAFMYAGAPSVAVSLWRVADRSTSLLMERFYADMIRNRAEKASALRKAKLHMLERVELSHPFHWAPFILVGDWR